MKRKITKEEIKGVIEGTLLSIGVWVFFVPVIKNFLPEIHPLISLGIGVGIVLGILYFFKRD